ncbi:MAG: hypothetical protein RSE23_14100 [Clostridia bacterium]
MKKTIAIVLVLTMVFAFASSAMAVGTRFDIVTSSTTSLMTGCSGLRLTGTYWFMRLDENTSNLSPTHRAVTRVHQGTNPISATWVYSGPNETNHPHTFNKYSTTNASFRGRLDDRDSGTLEFHGYFHHSY